MIESWAFWPNPAGTLKQTGALKKAIKFVDKLTAQHQFHIGKSYYWALMQLSIPGPYALISQQGCDTTC